MWEMWAAVIAALGLAFGLARYDPEKFDPFAKGALSVLWPAIAAMMAWDAALLVTALKLKAVLGSGEFAAASAAVKDLAPPKGAGPAALSAATGLSVIRYFVSRP